MPPTPDRKPLDATRRRALTVLANSPDGATEAILLAHGFPAALMVGLVRAGLATTTVHLVRAAGRELQVTRVWITDVGRQALG